MVLEDIVEINGFLLAIIERVILCSICNIHCAMVIRCTDVDRSIVYAYNALTVRRFNALLVLFHICSIMKSKFII